MKGLTKKQHEILTFIQNFIREKHFSPSFREIKQQFGFSSVASVYKHIRALQKKGVIDGVKHAARSLVLTQPLKSQVYKNSETPFIGYISAGMPIEIFSQAKSVAVPNYLLYDPENTYVLQIKGKGLEEEMMGQGDLVVVEARQNAFPGETVLALVNGRDIIIKKYFPLDEYVQLVSCSENLQPIMIREEDIEVQGIITGVIRPY